MSDKKLDELIEDLVCATVILVRSPKGINPNSHIQDCNKVKQAIVDYVEQEKREAYDKGYEKAVALWKDVRK